MMVFVSYEAARQEAQTRADACNGDVGIEKADEFGRPVFRVFYLPPPARRAGHELYCEVVHPNPRRR